MYISIIAAGPGFLECIKVCVCGCVCVCVGGGGGACRFADLISFFLNIPSNEIILSH